MDCRPLNMGSTTQIPKNLNGSNSTNNTADPFLKSRFQLLVGEITCQVPATDQGLISRSILSRCKDKAHNLAQEKKTAVATDTYWKHEMAFN
jgi:hypothetical protein